MTPQGYKIFLTRYALQDKDKKFEINDRVVVIPDPKKDEREIGNIVGIKRGLSSELRSDINKVSISKKPSLEQPLEKEEIISVVVKLWESQIELEVPISQVDRLLEFDYDQTRERIAGTIAGSTVKDSKRSGLAGSSTGSAGRSDKVGLERENLKEAFKYLLKDFKFIPGGRILSGAGTNSQLTYYNCFVIPRPHDSRQGILNTLSEMTEIMARGGGVGINISSLRPRGAVVRGVNGRSSGPVPWAELYSSATGLIIQGGSRRGALMLMMEDWHPDVLEFISSKRDMKILNNANISVAVSDSFMEAVKNDGDWTLKFPDTSYPKYNELWDGNIKQWEENKRPTILYTTIKARELWDKLVESAWASAEPGVWFIERANKLSNSYYFSPLISTNPCVTGDTLVHTSLGIKKVSSLTSKSCQSIQLTLDSRMDKNLRYSTVQPFFVSGSYPKCIYELQTVEGYHVRATSNHKVKTPNGWVEMVKLKYGDYIYVLNREPEIKSIDSRISLLEGKEKGTSMKDFTLFPEYLFTENISFQIGFLQAIFERYGKIESHEKGAGRGTISISICVNSVHFLSRLQIFLLNFNIFSTFEKSKQTIPELKSGKALVISGRSILKFREYIGFLNEDKNEKIDQIINLSKCMPSSLYTEKFIATVKSVKELGREVVYDVTEPITHSFSANGIIVHNCGEVPLPAWGVCNLGSINLSKFAKKLVGNKTPTKEEIISSKCAFKTSFQPQQPEKKGGNITDPSLKKAMDPALLDPLTVETKKISELEKLVEVDSLRKVIHYSVRFLDNVIDSTPYFNSENETLQKKERRVGLGTMGLAELLIKCKITYGNNKRCIEFIDNLYEFIANEAYIASSKISFEKGSFPAFIKEKFLNSEYVKRLSPKTLEHIKKFGIRNCTLLTQAPTGATGTMVNTSTGIEPFYHWKFTRTGRLGKYEERVNVYDEWIKVNGENTPLPEYFVSAMDLSTEDHVMVQTTIQKWVDASISKTCNVPNSYTIEETKKLYELIYNSGGKGVTIYRDRCRDQQVLELMEELPKKEIPYKEIPKKEISAKGFPKKEIFPYKEIPKKEILPYKEISSHESSKNYRVRPSLLEGKTYRKDTPTGTAYITVNVEGEDKSPFEVFVNVAKAGSDIAADAEGYGRLISLILRMPSSLSINERISEISSQLRGIGSGRAKGFGRNRIMSLPDAISQVLSGYSASKEITGLPQYESRLDETQLEGEICPSCGNTTLIRIEGCKKCINCDYSAC